MVMNTLLGNYFNIFFWRRKGVNWRYMLWCSHSSSLNSIQSKWSMLMITRYDSYSELSEYDDQQITIIIKSLMRCLITSMRRKEGVMEGTLKNPIHKRGRVENLSEIWANHFVTINLKPGKAFHAGMFAKFWKSVWAVKNTKLQYDLSSFRIKRNFQQRPSSRSLKTFLLSDHQ